MRAEKCFIDFGNLVIKWVSHLRELREVKRRKGKIVIVMQKNNRGLQSKIENNGSWDGIAAKGIAPRDYFNAN